MQRTDEWKSHPETKEVIEYLNEVIKLWTQAWLTGSADKEALERGQHYAQAAHEFKDYILRGEQN